jgi:hypothetical protein
MAIERTGIRVRRENQCGIENARERASRGEGSVAVDPA